MMEVQHPWVGDEEDALIGEASHELGARMIEDYTRGPSCMPADVVIGERASNGVIWDQESYDGARMYADHVRSIMQSTGCFVPRIEERVSIARIHPDCWGTPDCWLFDKAAGVLHLWDYKYGHLIVEAFENWQSIEYIAGILDELGIDGFDAQYIRVQIHIVQPRAPHRLGTIRTWEIAAVDLRPYFNIAEAFEAEAMSDNPTCNTGPHCRNCSARVPCWGHTVDSFAAIAYSGQPYSTPRDSAELGLELRLVNQAIDTLKARKTGLEAQAEATIRDGGSVPGWAVEPGQTRTRWAVPTAEVLTLGDMLGIDLRKPPEPITPAQAEKLGIDPAVISGYSETPTGALKLVESTKTIAAAVFSKRMN